VTGPDIPTSPPDNHLDMPRLAAIYDRTAAFYDTVVADVQASAKLVAIETLSRRPSERFLEVGAGTAWLLARIVQASGTKAVIGLDLAPGMIEVARRRLIDEAGLTYPPLIIGDTTALPFADGAFDCLLITYTLEVLPSDAILPALRECLRVLREGGRLVALNLTPGQGDDAAMTTDWQERFTADPEAFGGARPLEATRMLQQAGFENVTRRYVGPKWPSEILLGYKPG
jgi:ubiquinone/menaquinone biosynthesis C-methylase UbiE